jgi:aminoglycoside phosphotransferase family enzyme/predicted kinase
LDRAVHMERLPDGLVEDLLQTPGYPLDENAAKGIEHIQTHLSHVFLLRDRVYKLRKAAALGFVNFGLRDARNIDCLDELRLNRRLAPGIYLGIASVVSSAAGYRVAEVVHDPEALDDALEHCVVMARLEEGRDTLSLLEAGLLTPEIIDRLAEKIATFHAGLAPHRDPGEGDVRAPAEANLVALETAGNEIVAQHEVAELRARVETGLADRAADFERRRHAGRVIDGHGDLHLQHVWVPTPAVDHGDLPIIDCLEFSQALRTIDVAAEVAFFAMDLAYRDAGELAERFLRQYALEGDDYDLYSVVDFYISHRAAVRAKVAALAAADLEIAAAQREAARVSALRHVQLSRRVLDDRPPGDLLLVGGTVGSGKSTVAFAVAETLSAVVISSDRVRKAALGLAPTDRLGAEVDAGAYSPAARARVYAGMLERANAVAASGRSVVLDATWSSRAERERARDWAKARGMRCAFIETHCDEATVRARLEARKARGDDPSDAGPELLEASRASFEALDHWPAQTCANVDTGPADWRTGLAEVTARLGLRSLAGETGGLYLR